MHASFCSVIVHRSNYRSSLIKSLSFRSLCSYKRGNVVQVFENTGNNTRDKVSPRGEDFKVCKPNGISFQYFFSIIFLQDIHPPSTWRKFPREWRARRNWITRLIELRRDVELERRFVRIYRDRFTKNHVATNGFLLSHEKSIKSLEVFRLNA